jgi:NADH-quinone oxidoreductase subunit L
MLPVVKTWTWWTTGGFDFTIGQHIDGLSLTVLIVVAFISTLVQIYSVEYLHGDRRYTHFFAALTLFSAGMMNMVIADNMLQFILGWEIMGLVFVHVDWTLVGRRRKQSCGAQGILHHTYW